MPKVGDCCGSPQRNRVSGDLAAGPDGAAVRAGMPAAKNAEVTLTNDDRVRNVIHNFNTDGIDSLHPNYSGSRPKAFTLPKRREIKKTAKSNHLPSSTWNLTQPADFLDAEGVVDDINHEGLRILLREEGVSFPRLKTWKTSRAPDYAAKKSRFELLRASLRDRRRRGHSRGARAVATRANVA